jgi:hypothetical protein
VGAPGTLPRDAEGITKTKGGGGVAVERVEIEVRDR